MNLVLALACFGCKTGFSQVENISSIIQPLSCSIQRGPLFPIDRSIITPRDGIVLILDKLADEYVRLPFSIPIFSMNCYGGFAWNWPSFTGMLQEIYGHLRRSGAKNLGNLFLLLLLFSVQPPYRGRWSMVPPPTKNALLSFFFLRPPSGPPS